MPKGHGETPGRAVGRVDHVIAGGEGTFSPSFRRLLLGKWDGGMDIYRYDV